MYKFLTLLGLLLLTLQSGCRTGYCACAVPMLNIFTDRNLIVTEVSLYNPLHGELQIGDKLLNARPARQLPDLSPDPIPFTDQAIKELIGYRMPALIASCCGGPPVPLILQVERNGEVIEIDAAREQYKLPTPTMRQTSPLVSPQPTPTPAPTPTPVPRDWLYF